MIGKLLRAAFGKPEASVDRRAEVESLIARLTDASPADRVQAIERLTAIDRESATHHREIVRALLDFVRGLRAKGVAASGEPGRDLKAALGALARRAWTDTETEALALCGLDLTGLSIAGADFRNADLSHSALAGCNFLGSKLRGANLAGAVLDDSLLMAVHLEGANLAGASLRSTNLTDAFLDDASLAGSDLRFAILVKASLRSADLAGSTFEGTQLGGANLAGVRGLTREQLAAAEVDDLTLLPDELASTRAAR